jgi:hypothetical protein
METGIIIGGFFAVIFGALFVQRIMRERRDRQVPMFAINTCPDRAHVKVLGAAVASDGIPLLVAPFSQTPCLGYFVVAVYNSEDNRKEITSTRWSTIPFLLMDGTGVAEVGTGTNDTPVVVANRLAVDRGLLDNGAHERDFPAVRTMFDRDRVGKLQEFVLLPQDRVLVYAYAMRQPGLAGATLRLLKPPPGSSWKIESVT